MLSESTINEVTEMCGIDAAMEMNLTVELIKEFKNINVVRRGAYLWVSGDTKPLRNELKGLKLRWSPNNQMWYWKPPRTQGVRWNVSSGADYVNEVLVGEDIDELYY